MTRQILAPGVLLLLFWMVIPSRLPEPPSAPSHAECAALAERGSQAGVTPTRTIERCSALLPDDVELLGDLAGAYETAGRSADAEAAYRKALDRDPDYADVRLRLGRLLLKRGAANEALQQATRALEIQPNRQALVDLRTAAETALGGAQR